MSTTTVTTTTKKAAAGQAPSAKRSPPGQGKSRSARRRRARQQSGQIISTGAQRAPTASNQKSFAQKYTANLVDPFSHPPERLGLGTMVPTEIGYAHINTKITSGGDGSLLLMIRPNVKNPLAVSVAATAAVPVWSLIQDGAWPTATNLFETARPVALGVRITPDSSSNDKPSRAAVSQLSSRYETLALAAGVDSVNHQSWSSSHLANSCILASGGSTSCVGSWRPMDLKNFEFDRQTLTDQTTATAITPMNGPTLFAAVSGPASMAYFIEVVFFYEATSTPFTVTGLSENIGSGYASLDTFFEYIRPYLTAQNAMKLVQAAAGVDSLSGAHLRSFETRKMTYHLVKTLPRQAQADEKVDDTEKINRIGNYLNEIDFSSISDSDRQHLLSISSLLCESPVLVGRAIDQEGPKRTSRPSHR